MTLPWWQGIVLGVVQGLSEFLPVSSSGHLVLAQWLLGYQSPGVSFEVFLHVATLLSVVLVYRRRVGWLVHGMLTRDGEAWRFAGLLMLASIPAAIAGLLFRDVFEAQFESPVAVGSAFLMTAAILWSTRGLPRYPEETPVGWRSAVAMGLAQVLAILPGVSRSGATIGAGLWSGGGARASAEFSFLMAVVVIAGTGLLEGLHLLSGEAELVMEPGLFWAFLAALGSGVVAIMFLVMLLRRGRFYLFAPYCAALGIGTLLWAFLR
jgi:undecaprenyl-diphosphatase